MGAEHDAEILCDRLGTAVHDGGLAVTARDLLRFGQLLLDGGVVPSGAGEATTVLPPQWLRAAWAVDSDHRTAFLDSPAEQSFPGGWYRNQFWFRPGEHGDVLLCLGIHGQMMHVEPAYGHGVREALQLAGRAEPDLPAGHPARLRRDRRASRAPAVHG